MIAAAPLHELIASASQVATGALAAAIWQGILLAGAAAVGLRLLPDTPARVRFAIWFAVFALLAALPFAPLWIHHGAAGAAAPPHARLTVDARWCLWIAALWAAASLARAVALAVAAHRVRALWKRARPVPLPLPVGDCAGRNLELCISDEVDRPTVIGFFAPRIVLPQWLLAKLTPAELDQIVLHEAGHLSRRDDWLNLLQKLALVFFPLNPALVWIERRLCLERELACDERVLGATSAPIAYAECLARIAEYRLERRGLVQGLALALGAVGRESELARRVVSLLSRRPGMKRAHARLIFGGAMLMLVFAAGAFERSPQLVAFSSAAPIAANSAGTLAESGFRAVSVRAAAGTPGQAWRTSGDAPARLAKKRSRIAGRRDIGPAGASSEVTSAAKAVLASADVSGTAEAVPLSKTDSAIRSRVSAVDAGDTRMFQTVTTTRELAPDGEVLVTRWLTVSRSSDDDAPSAARSQRLRTERTVQRFAAVPVQGGWLVFQL